MIKPIKISVRQSVLSLVFLVLVTVLLLIGSGWFAIESVLEKTGDAQFCGTCHSMQVFVSSYTQDAHGGNNRLGVTADCVDCHLPHDGLISHIITKIRFGINDVWHEFFTNTDEIDWVSRLENRENYVFDSGCLQCHQVMENAGRGIAKAETGHQGFVFGASIQSCVSCHEHVGHKDLEIKLSGAD